MKLSSSALLLLLLTLLAGCAGTLSPSHQNPAAYTHLDAAIEACDLTATRRLIKENPYSVNERGWGHTTPLYLACLNNCTEIAELLIENGADVNAKGVEDATPLHIAAQKGNLGLVKLLISHSASIDAKDRKGRTPRDRALQWDRTEVARFLSP